MRAALLLLVVVACDAQGMPICFEDHFETLASRWTIMNPGSGAVTANGRLQIAVSPTASFEGIKGVEAFDLRDGFVVAEVARYPEPTEAAQSELVVRIDDSNQIFIGFAALAGRGPSFILRQVATSGPDDEDIIAPFDATVRYWRVASRGDTVVIDSSADGAAWTHRKTAAALFALDAVTLQLESDTFASVAVPGSFEVERVIVASPSCERADALAPHP